MNSERHSRMGLFSLGIAGNDVNLDSEEAG